MTRPKKATPVGRWTWMIGVSTFPGGQGQGLAGLRMYLPVERVVGLCLHEVVGEPQLRQDRC